MGKKGSVSTEGEGEDWLEPKTERTTVQLTKTGKRLARERANRLGISLSEVLERWGRGIPVDRDEVQPVVAEDARPNFELIIKNLPSYSKRQLARLIKTAIDLLLGTDHS